MDQPQITPGQNGYMAELTQRDYGQNPWQVEDFSHQIDQGQKNMQGMQGKMDQFAQASSPYPSFPNSAGLGSQNAYSQGGQSGSVIAPPTSGTTTVNPWSFQGEALSR